MIATWLHQFPNIVMGLIIISTLLLVSTILPIVIRHRFNLTPSDPMAKGADEAFKIFTSLTLMLLAFCFVRAQTDHRNIEDLVSREATIIFKLNRALGSFGGDDAAALQDLTKKYATSIIDDEWPLMVIGDRSGDTANLLADLIQGCRELQPTTVTQQVARSEILPTITQVSDVREARLAASHLGLPIYYWEAVGSSLAVLIFLGWLLTPLPRMALYVGPVTVGVALLLTVLIATSGIFEGESRVTADAIEQMLPLLGS
jgi:hypothetical protein